MYENNYCDKFCNFVNCAVSPRHIPNQKGTRQLNYYTQTSKQTVGQKKHKQLKQFNTKINKYLRIKIVHLAKKSTTPLRGLCFFSECIFVQLAVSNNSVNTKTAKLLLHVLSLFTMQLNANTVKCYTILTLAIEVCLWNHPHNQTMHRYCSGWHYHYGAHHTISITNCNVIWYLATYCICKHCGAYINKLAVKTLKSLQNY